MRLLPILALALSSPQAEAESVCITGDITAAMVADHERNQVIWHYTAEISWASPLPPMQDSGPITIEFMDLKECPCICVFPRDYITFSDVAGRSLGQNGCEVYYRGEFVCLEKPIRVAWLPADPTLCAIAPTATGTFGFFSKASPVHTNAHPISIYLGGGYHCRGAIRGMIPQCECGATSVDESTWAMIKGVYR
jgi:hypothetical protein